MKPKQKYYEVTAKEIIKNFKKRNIEGYYCSNSKAAANKVMELISENSTVAWGGSMTRKEIGLLKKLQKADLELLDRTKAQNWEEQNEIYRKSFYSDYYLMSSNAITQDGKLVNIDGIGNRVAALCYGPKNNHHCRDE